MSKPMSKAMSKAAVAGPPLGVPLLPEGEELLAEERIAAGELDAAAADRPVPGRQLDGAARWADAASARPGPGATPPPGVRRGPTAVRQCGARARSPRWPAASPSRTQARRASWCTLLSTLVKSRNWSSPGAMVGGWTMWSSSSIHTTDGTLVMPKRSAVTWAGSMTAGKVGAAASIHGRASSGEASSATENTESPSGPSSSCSACHAGSSWRQPHHDAHVTSTRLRPVRSLSECGVPSSHQGEVGGGAARQERGPFGGRWSDGRDTLDHVRGHRDARGSAAHSARSIRSGRSATATWWPSSGTQISPRHRPFGLEVPAGGGGEAVGVDQEAAGGERVLLAVHVEERQHGGEDRGGSSAWRLA